MPTTYDTTKAKYIDGYTVTHSFSERYEVLEYLYRTPTGEYFTGRFGGERTEYAEGVITPLSPAEARAWATDHMTEEARLRLMPEIFKPQPKTEPQPAASGIQVQITITPESVERFLSLASLYAPALLGSLGQLIGHGIDDGDTGVAVI